MAVSPAFAGRITRTWMRHAPRFFWGDRLDGRFIAAAELTQVHGRRVLDIGCNAGILLSELDADNVRVGVDLSDEALRIAATLNPSAGIVKADMLHLPFRDGSFDVVVFCGMLEVPPHERKTAAMAEASRVLRPGGELLLTTSNRRYLRYRYLDSRVTYEELQAFLEPGFDATIQGFNPLPPFPYGLPNGLLARVPGIWRLLMWLMERGIGTRWSCTLLATAVKRPTQVPSTREPAAAPATMEATNG